MGGLGFSLDNWVGLGLNELLGFKSLTHLIPIHLTLLLVSQVVG